MHMCATLALLCRATIQSVLHAEDTDLLACAPAQADHTEPAASTLEHDDDTLDQEAEVRRPRTCHAACALLRVTHVKPAMAAPQDQRSVCICMLSPIRLIFISFL